MLAIAYGGQFVTTRVRGLARVSHRLQQGFGAGIIVFAAAKYLQYDTLITAWFSEFYPNGQFGMKQEKSMNIRSKSGATVLASACLLVLAQASYADEGRDHAKPTLAEAQRVAPNFVGV